MPLLSFTIIYSTMALLSSTGLYYSLPRICLALLDCSTLYHGSTGIYYNLPRVYLVLLGFTTLYYLLWIYLALLDSISLYT